MDFCFPVLALTGVTEPGMMTVVFTGISLVFLILVLLYAVVTIQGKFFDVWEAGRPARDAKKAEKKAAKAGKPVAPATSAPKAPAAAPAPVVEEGIPPEVVAAIVAAVASVSGGQYQLRAVSRASGGRGAWGLAGVVSSTEPF